MVQNKLGMGGGGAVWQSIFLPCRSFEVRTFYWRRDDLQGIICPEVFLQDEVAGWNEGLMEKMRELKGGEPEEAGAELPNVMAGISGSTMTQNCKKSVI